jgi:hypothetical protein
VEISRCADVTTLTKIVLATAGTAVNDHCLDRLAIVTYLNLLQKGIKTGHIGLNELPHLLAMSSVIIDLCGNGDDKLASGICFTTIAKARIIPGSLRTKMSAS